jgi:hypothetical protein
MEITTPPTTSDVIFGHPLASIKPNKLSEERRRRRNFINFPISGEGGFPPDFQLKSHDQLISRSIAQNHLVEILL